jgi:hypothetical protein
MDDNPYVSPEQAEGRHSHGRWKRATWISIIVGIVCVAIAVTCLTLVDIIPPRSTTAGNMHMTKRRILRFAATHGSLPTSLEQLPCIEGYVNETTDGWGRPILWRIDGDDVILTSYGRDGVPGGTGEDADMVGAFRTKTGDGEWADELCEWRHNPFDADNNSPSLRPR